jgi:hypothetical protein
MDHGEAQTTKASERYLLGEMSEPERFDFESHYFTCEVCAEDVRTGVVLARGIKAVSAKTPSREIEVKEKRGWFDWLTPLVLAPSTAAVALAMLAGYQAFVVIPPMRETAAPQAMTPVILRAVARGEDPVIQVERKPGLSILALDVNSGSPGQPISYQLLPPGGIPPITGSTAVPPAGSQLVLALSNATLQHAGAWTLVLRTPQGAEAGSYPFRIEIK